ncbi:hypothetical protein DICPUDRAFT_47033 [Dictyostelium purpureum]|uniref:GH18 domain-containing protein n=1 Tax=Dictyostelium purpureum TaxID=5786 RepID=F0ZHD0_DICPU|nr:uncharacterized protein DICPUDRAFT_47033 [Dictyostelium purpureum]EGC36663.1 hypothetical protein DICPUDRAFT_47033 [Dictyostelium purpureum]|eukprot:XP_003286831.1 hypothetical protein DICPUDRAFT_47033 [Dictyostelium purpureum]
MKYFFIIFIIFLYINKITCINNKPCPCSNQKLCEPVSVGYRKEFLGFSVNNTHYPYYDWDILTTIGVFYDEPIEDELLCLAHSKDVRLVYSAYYPVDQLGNYTQRTEWINEKVEQVVSTYADGVNFDVEDPITNATIAQWYTELVDETNKAFKSINPYYSVTVDIAWSPNCIDDRCYDYVGLSKVSDYMVVMDYDLRSRVYGVSVCTASANSPPELIIEGLLNFTKLGISPDVLVMGLPFYGYNYSCINSNSTFDSKECVIPAGSYLGCNCTDAVGNEVNYDLIMDMLQDDSIKKSPLGWDRDLQSPFFNFIDPSTNSKHQMWFDNPESLEYKVKMARKYELRGVSVWNIDQLNTHNQKQSDPMWESLGIFFK